MSDTPVIYAFFMPRSISRVLYKVSVAAALSCKEAAAYASTRLLQLSRQYTSCTWSAHTSSYRWPIGELTIEMR